MNKYESTRGGMQSFDGVGVRNARAPVMKRNVKTKLLLMVITGGLKGEILTKSWGSAFVCSVQLSIIYI
jgi:hypothetical protein